MRGLITQAVQVVHSRDQRYLPPQVGGAVADIQEDVAERQDAKAWRPQVHQWHEPDQQQTDRRRAEATAPIQVLAKDEIREQPTERADQLQDADIRVAGLEAIHQHQGVQRRGHE